MATAHKGKTAEFLVFSELLKRGADIYIPLVDQGIDAVVIKSDRTAVKIQIKSTEEAVDNKRFDIWFNDADTVSSDVDFFIILVFLQKPKSKKEPEFWILPAPTYFEYANKTTHSKGTDDEYVSYCLDLNSASRKHGNKLRQELLKDFKNNWNLLE